MLIVEKRTGCTNGSRALSRDGGAAPSPADRGWRRGAAAALSALLLLLLCTEARGSAAATSPSLNVWWMAPFFSGGGYCSEAVAFTTALAKHPEINIRITQHGDGYNQAFVQGLDEETMRTLTQQHRYFKESRQQDTIVVCHSEPGAWNPPKYSTPACPPQAYSQWRYVIGRTMFETDRVAEEHVRRCNRMDEVWVPTAFHRETFAASGVELRRLRVVPEPVDVRFFDPDAAPARAAPPPATCVTACHPRARPVTSFFSVFKWETRKAWDVLMKAFVSAFEADDDVALYILTSPYHDSEALGFAERLQRLTREYAEAEPARLPRFAAQAFALQALPPVYLIDSHIPNRDLPALYKAMDAFVLPSRGEGWGRPHVEAMAMGLPIIATNWSGPTEYMTPHNSYPLRIDGLTTVQDGPFKGHQWAEPSLEHLRELLREVHAQPAEARRRGEQARRDMVDKYSPEVVAKLVAAELERVQSQGLKKRPEHEDL